MFPPFQMKRTNNKNREKPKNLQVESIKRKTVIKLETR